MTRTITTVAGTVVHIDDDATDVDAADCAVCELTPAEAVTHLLRWLRAGVPFVLCAGCADRAGHEAEAQLYRQPGRGRA